MERKFESPMDVVEESVAVLSRISSLCAIMVNIDDHLDLRSEDVGQVMVHLQLCLDEQIEALDGIRWTPEPDALQ